MPLWGNSDAVEAKPKHFTDAEKLNVYATEKGWVKKITGTGGRANRIQEEVIVAIGDLGAALNLADITAIDWNIDSFDKSDGGTLSVTVTFNEPVEVNTAPGTPTLTVTNDTNSNHTLLYTGGTGTNRLTFELAIAAANAATDADDVLSIAANCVALASGTITEMSTEHFTLESGADEFIRLEGVGVGYINQESNTASTITQLVALGTAAGTITVSA